MFNVSEATVDLSAIHDNLVAVRERVGGRQVLLAVKANAYGHGAEQVALMVQHTGCADRLAVATVQEGVTLREQGITIPILKLSHCFPEELDDAIAAGLTLTMVDAEGIARAQTVAAARGVTVAVHLKVDTGMRRIGAEPHEAVALAQAVDAAPNLFLEGIFTHPPVSDMPSQDAFTVAELDGFRSVVAQVEAEVGPIPLVHAAPSGVILGHDLTGMTMVRAGIMAYGYYPDASTPRTVGLRRAMVWRTRISFLKRVPAGETVGYGRTWAPEQETWVATIPVGYADGYSRRNSNQGHVLVAGRKVPVVGRVCMDQSMVDLGPEDPGVAVGDEVVLMGCQGDEEITADDLAAVMGTISYEVTCLVSPRVPRVHLGGR